MSQILLGVSALVISTALILYSSVIAFQITTPIIAKLSVGAPLSGFSFSGLFQNLGIVTGLAGATFRNLDLLTVAVLLIALAITIKDPNSPELDRAIEVPLLISGLLALGSVCLARVVA